MKKFTDMQILWLKQNCEGLSYQELTEALNYRFNSNHSKSSVRNKIVSMRLGKKIRLERQYTEAQLSFLYTNREMPYVDLTKAFNRVFGENKSEGAIRVAMRANGWGRLSNRSIRQERKIEIKGRRINLDHYVWECVNGPIPPGFTVIHLDDDVQNNKIENLKLAPNFTRTAFLLAGGGTAPKSLAPAMYAKVLLQNVIRQKEKLLNISKR